MIDERESVARVAGHFTLPEPRFERLLRRRDRKRRNERLAAGTAGVTIAILAIVVALRTLAADVSQPATTPSPTPATTVIRFESPLYGYALTHPDDWMTAASSATWTSGPLTLRVADVLEGVDAEGIFLAAGSIEIPDGMTPDEWLDREERRAVVVAGIGDAGSTFVPTVVDGVAGRLSADCGVLLVVEDRHGYVFRLYADITVNTDLREVIRSIELHPETL